MQKAEGRTHHVEEKVNSNALEVEARKLISRKLSDKSGSVGDKTRGASCQMCRLQLR